LTPDIVTGFIYALISLAFFSLYALPRRYVNSGSMEYMLSLCVGSLACTSLVGWFLTRGAGLPIRHVLLSYLSGLIWFLATLSFVYSVDCMGLGRAAVLRNTTVAFGVLFGIALFGEYSLRRPFQLLLVLLGAATVIAAASIFSKIAATSDVVRPSCPVNLIRPKALVRGMDRRPVLVGTIFGLVAALLYASYTVPGKIVMNESPGPWQYFFMIGQGAFVACLAGYFMLTRTKVWTRVSLRDHALALLAGALWSAAFGFMLMSMRILGLAIAWSMINLSAVVQLLVSILVLKEIPLDQHRRPVVLGSFAAVAGIVLLGLSKM
jgi:glucose uptake protein GlcU